MMLVFAAAAIAASTVPAGPPRVAVQAQATVRIMSGVRLKLDSVTNTDAPRAHDSRVLASDGSRRPARLIEFE